MANVQDGSNQGRTGVPARQAPTGSKTRNGRAVAGLDPTNQEGQVPADIFGISQSYHSGAPGTAGATGEPQGVTLQHGQLDPSFSNLTDSEVLNSGMPAGQGAGQPGHGGESVTYSDPFGIVGGVNRTVTVQGNIGGDEDWTKGIDGYSPGATPLPGLGGLPRDTGVGRGKARTENP